MHTYPPLHFAQKDTVRHTKTRKGSSVANAFLHSPGWKIRGISRDALSLSSLAWISKGVEMVTANLEDVESLKAAFRGASVVFGNTDFWGHMQDSGTYERARLEGRSANEVARDREIEQGKHMVDAVAAITDSDEGLLERFVLSTLSDCQGWSKGAISFNQHFDAKAAQVEYLRRVYPELAKKTSLLQMGMYMSNWETSSVPRPARQSDGEFKVRLPIGGDVKVPMVDARTDTGVLVKALVELPAGVHLVGAGSCMSWNEWCRVWGKANGVACVFERSDRMELEEYMGATGREFADMFQYVEEFGYDGGDPGVVYPWDVSFHSLIYGGTFANGNTAQGGHQGDHRGGIHQEAGLVLGTCGRPNLRSAWRRQNFNGFRYN
ncbi:hypothetical protein BCR34DRAFT_559233 [Clohesyomyces aquaticus]|uniref:NmrA-like domain-containing protein n=1 Tax=Clohesyomyces aquaticus TaxID=1231657 RepID=A0A1Y1ZY40_9PLEO|nr:hypothetical protein BCR34DRAFT_559233 [Clohesyomyces aquaticus]